MRKQKTRFALSALAVLALAFAVPPAARALGLGSIHSRSRIGEYFFATIPILGARPSDLRGLRVRLASRRRFAALGLVKSSVLYDLEFRVLPVPHHRHQGVIVVRSLRPLRVPFLSFVLHVRWPSGVLLRSYTVLLRPPLVAARASPTSIASPTAPPTAPAPSMSSSPPPPPRVRRTSALPPAPLRRVYGPVRPGQSLWGIARRLRPRGVTTDRMMDALYKANPHAFIGNINLLRAGYVLRVPSARAIAAVGRRQAVDFVLREDRLWAHASRTAVPSKRLELLTPTVVGSRPPVSTAALARLRHRLRSMQGRLAKTQAALTRARRTIAALRRRLALSSVEASRLAHKPAAKPLPPPAAHPRPAPAFPWVPVLIVFFLILLAVTLILWRRSARAEKPRRGRTVRNDDFAPDAVLARAPLAESAEPKEEVSRGPEPSVPKQPQASRPAPEPRAAPAATGPRVALLAEVDFSLAYGLQDQAVESLRSYLAQNPGDEEVHAKLVEVYANSRNADAFLEAAAAHRASFGPDAHGADIARWAESLGVADRLRAPLPSSAEDAHVSTEVETVFDDILSTPTLESTGGASLDDSNLLSREATIGTATETALEFDIDLASFETPVRPAESGTKSGDDTQSQFEESLKALRDTATGTATGTGEAMPGGATATDAVATKLSLIRAYLDMGDHDGARDLLDEVLREGSAEQRAEAERLSQRLRG